MVCGDDQLQEPPSRVWTDEKQLNFSAVLQFHRPEGIAICVKHGRVSDAVLTGARPNLHSVKATFTPGACKEVLYVANALLMALIPPALSLFREAYSFRSGRGGPEAPWRQICPISPMS